MPRRSLDPGAKPFEVKVGIGFQSFGGMYCLGDPSMCPPNRFRRLVNVRLGEKDVDSRPGLAATWDSGTGAPVVGMIELFKAQAPKLWFHEPAGTTLESGGGFDVYTHVALAKTLILDNAFPYNATPAVAGYLAYYLPYAMPVTPSNANQVQQSLGDQLGALLAPASHYPFVWHSGDNVNAITGKTVLIERSLYALGVDASNGSTIHTHSWLGETVVSDLGVNYVGTFPDEHQWGCCLDPPMLFQGKWIAAGSIVSLVLNPGVAAGGDANTGGGQQVFELLYDGHTLVQLLSGDPVYGGSATELFRLPGLSYSVVPTRASGGLDGKTIRSMSVRSTRQDHPITAAELTSEKLYMGTFGGYPVLAGGWEVTPPVIPADPPGELRPPIQTITNGEVYSFDGSTVKQEVSTGVGSCVVVTTLPDGSILACGRTGAKLLDASDETWKVVTYDTPYSTVPRVTSVQPYPVGGVDAGWMQMGFIWTDRIVFRGTAYYVGYDTARLAQNANASGSDWGLLPPAATALGPFYVPTVDAWVLYRFDRASLKMIRLRGGEEIYTALQPGHWSGLNASPFWQQMNAKGCPCLAIWNDTLVYSWSMTHLGGGTDTAPLGATYYIGSYNGTTFDDDAFALPYELQPLSGGGPARRATQAYVLDMLGTSRGVFVRYSDFFTDDADLQSMSKLALWTGGGTPGKILLFSPTGRMFLGPS